MATGDVLDNLFEYQSHSVRDGVPTVTRGYHVVEENPSQAIVNVGIPQYGEAHPDYSGLVVRSVAATPRGRGSLVQVTYSPIEYTGGGQPPVVDSAEDFFGLDVSFDYEEIDIPLFRHSEFQTTDAQGAPITEIVYSDYSAGIPYRKRVPYYRVTTGVVFNEPASLGDILDLNASLILTQTDRIHNIFGRDLLFSCEGLQYVSRTEYKVTYRWSQDPGIPNEWESDAPFDEKFSDISTRAILGRRGSIIYPAADEDYVIPPFKGMRIDGNTDPTQFPTVTFFDRYKRDDEGWTNLPGLL